MERTNKKRIAVVGATRLQGGAVIRALQANKQFKARALTRNPAAHSELADEVAVRTLQNGRCKLGASEKLRLVPLRRNID
jgi:hypothetical protein